MGTQGISRRVRALLPLTWQASRLVCLLAMGAVFTVSAAGKFRLPRSFLGSVADYRLLPQFLNTVVAATLPGVEMVTGLVFLAAFLAEVLRLRFTPGLAEAAVGLYAPSPRPAWLRKVDVWVDAAALLMAGMLVAFIFGMSVDILRGFTLDCGCFDFLGEHIPFLKSSKVTWGTVWRDVVMLALLVPAFIRKS